MSNARDPSDRAGDDARYAGYERQVPSTAQSQYDLSIVISTIGRADVLERLLQSIADESVRLKLEVIIVDQGLGQPCGGLAQADRWPYAVRYTTSSLGLSHGRNVGLGLASGSVTAFPDDDAWYVASSLAAVTRAFSSDPKIGIVTGKLVDAEGRRNLLRFPRRPVRITRWNTHKTALSSTLFVRREHVVELGGFDEELGLGSSGWHQAGEETDLLLRALSAGVQGRYDPRVRIGHPRAPNDGSLSARRRALLYACGEGEVWRRHGVPRSLVCWLLARRIIKVGALLLLGRRGEARVGFARVEGIVAGIRMRCPREFPG